MEREGRRISSKSKIKVEGSKTKEVRVGVSRWRRVQGLRRTGPEVKFLLGTGPIPVVSTDLRTWGRQ